MSLPVLLTVPEAAAALKLSERSVRALYESGSIAITRVGRGRGAVRILESSLREYVEGGIENKAPPVKNGVGGDGFRILSRAGFVWPGQQPASNARAAGRGVRSA